MTEEQFWNYFSYHFDMPFKIQDVKEVHEGGLITLNDDDHPWKLSIERLPLPEDFEDKIRSDMDDDLYP